MLHVLCLHVGARDDHIKELGDPTNFHEAVAKTKVRPAQNSVQSA